jgi:hypothetical protein
LFLGHSKGQILKRCYAQGWSFARSKSSTAYFLLLFQAWGKCGVALILWKKTFRDNALCQFAEPIFLVLLVNDSECSRSAGAKPILPLSCIYLVSPGASAEAGEANHPFPLRSLGSAMRFSAPKK